MALSVYITICLLRSIKAFPLHTVGEQSTSPVTAFESGWVSTPNVRGTLDVLISCSITIALCAWTAYHPNVHPNMSKLKHMQRRMCWVLAAIVVPEVNLFCALDQWWTARKLQKEVNKYLKAGKNGLPKTGEKSKGASSNLSSDTDRAISDNAIDRFRDANVDEQSIEPWSLEHAFYATCGGIALESSSFWHQPVLTFTPAGILELAACGLLPNVSRKVIKEKSKANILAKLFVCIQGSWFYVQSIARLAQHLPLTLLEICTLVHVACLLLMYFLWIQKPYGIEYPTYLTDQRAIELAALFAVDNGEVEGGQRLYRE